MEHSATEPRITQGKTGDEFLANLKQREMHDAAEAWKIVMEFTHEVEHRGGTVVVAGGSVRDELMGLDIKDFDLEVYHLQPAEIKEIAEQYGRVEVDVGKAFPMLKLWFGNSQLDIGPPRLERKTGEGHNEYEMEAVPDMTTAEAVRRRDFTINALMKNPITGEIIDYVGGLDDIKNKKLRVVDPVRFTEDSLRVLRGIQFAGRFELTADLATKKLMIETAPRMKFLSRDRLRGEWEKLFNKGSRPSVGLELAREIGLFQNYPAIQDLKNTQQDSEYHPEGDVWTHTMLVVDKAAQICEKHKLSGDERLVVMLAAMGHDVGKSTTTIVGQDGRVHSNGHEQAGLEPMRQWLFDQGFTQKTIAKVLPIIQEHMHPMDLYKIDQAQGLGTGPIKRIARRLYPATIKDLVLVCEADHYGRDLPITDFPAGPWLLERAKQLAIEEKRPPSVIQGRDLQKLGYQDGVIFGKIIKAAEKLEEEKNMGRDNILEILKEQKTPEAALAALELLR